MGQKVIPGRLVEGYSSADRAGDFWIDSKGKRLAFICPCGCGTVGGVALKVNMADRGGKHPVWSWNQNREKPTLSPSILFTSGCKWHGFLTEGMWTWA